MSGSPLDVPGAEPALAAPAATSSFVDVASAPGTPGAPVTPPAPDAPTVAATAPAARAVPLRERLAPLGPVFLIVAVALAASATSLGNGFAFDDRWIIQYNSRVQDLSRWASIFRESYWPILSNGLYRPFTTLGYALQWAVGGGSPAPFHAVNVALYAGVCVAVWRLALRMLPEWAALAAACLFAAHPVHVEAVGNVVGQAELACSLLLVGCTSLYIGWRRAGMLAASPAHPGWPRIAAITACYAAATLYKEQGIVLPALLVAAEATVVADPRTVRQRAAAMRPMLFAMTLVAIVLLIVRFRVLGALSGDIPIPIIASLGMAERTLGQMGLVPELMRLLLWPTALSADYGPRHVTFDPTLNLWTALGIAITLGILVMAVRLRRDQPAVAFGVAWLAVTYAPVSNVVFPTGILLAERTLFAPTVGVVVAVAGLFALAIARAPEPARSMRLVAGLLLAVVALGTWRSADRQLVWKSNDVLFPQTVDDAPLSARAHYALGGHLFEQGKFQEAEREWRVAIALDSTATRIQSDLGDRYRTAGMCKPAEPLYRNVLKKEPHAEAARLGLVVCLRREGRRDEARQVAFAALHATRDARLGIRLLRYVRAPNDSAANAALGFKQGPKRLMPPGPGASGNATSVTPPASNTAPARGARAGNMRTDEMTGLPQSARTHARRGGEMPRPARDADG